MMKMMDRIAEGRGHLREIDMLLELTSVFFPTPPISPIHTFAYLYPSIGSRCTVNKSRVGLYVRLGTPLRGRFKV